MDDETKFGVDAHVPSDTEEFDQTAKKAVVQNQLTPKMEEVLRRLHCYTQWYIHHEDLGLGPLSMIMEMFENITIMHATMSVLGGYLKKGLPEMTDVIMLEKVAELMEEKLMDAQRNNHIIISPTGVEDEPQLKMKGPKVVKKNVNNTSN